jgi:hypothetical protein
VCLVTGPLSLPRSCIVARHARGRHRLGGEDPVESIRRDQAALLHEIPNRAAGSDGGLGDVGRLSVADVGAQRRGHGGAAIEQLAAAIGVRPDARDGARLQHPHGFPEDARGVNRVPGDHRHHHVQLELPGLGGRQDGRVAAEHLQPITWKQTWLTISGTDGFTLPGMIEDPGWTAGSRISEMPARGPMLRRRKSDAILPTSAASRRSAPE